MANDSLQKVADVPSEFIQEGAAFVRRCTKPDKKGTLNWGSSTKDFHCDSLSDGVDFLEYAFDSVAVMKICLFAGSI
jgi:hypothetical protein